MKPKPLSILNHFTVPVTWTDVPEDRPPDVADRKPDLSGVAGAAVLESTPKNMGDVRPRVSRTNLYFHGIPRLHDVDAALSEDAAVEEGVA